MTSFKSFLGGSQTVLLSLLWKPCFGTCIFKSASRNKGSSGVPQSILVVCGLRGPSWDVRSVRGFWELIWALAQVSDRSHLAFSLTSSITVTHTSPPGASTTSNQHQTAGSSRCQSPPPHATFANHLFCFGFLYSSGFPPTLPPLDQESETSGSHFNALVVLCGCLSATLFTFTLCITEKSLETEP